MSIFSKIFKSSSSIEKQLEEQHVPVFRTMMNMSPSQARGLFKHMLKEAKEESEREGTSNSPNNLGDIMLEKESTDENVRRTLAKIRKEDVRDEDIRWWWNAHDLERRMLLKVDDFCKKAMVLDTLKKEVSMNKDEAIAQAANRVRKHHPMYGDPDDTSYIEHWHLSDEDRPLPYELKNRIDNYIIQRITFNPEAYKREMEQASTFNALIRHEIKNGKL